MRFLCLHGSGTSTQWFQMQSAPLRYELGDEHMYEFVQGTVPWPMAAELEGISDPSSPHWSYCAHTVADYRVALDQLGDYVASEGPFDGVFGFSQGALLALLYLLRHQNSDSKLPSPFKCAVLLSLTGSVQQIQDILSLTRHEMVQIPVSVIWGKQDMYATSDDVLGRYWREDKVWKFIHAGGHEMPGPSIADSVSGAVRQIRRAIFQAQVKQ